MTELQRQLDDAEARKKAEGDIAHARKVAARYNYNGTQNHESH